MPTIDPSLTAVVKALYGDGVDPAELGKALDASEVHIDGTITGKRKTVRPVKRFVDEVKKEEKKDNKKALAAGLLAGSAIEAAAAKDTINPVKTAWKGDKTAPRRAAARRGVGAELDRAKSVGAKAKALKPLVVGAGGKHFPVSRGPATSAALQVGNFAVGLAAAKTLVGPKKPKSEVPVAKALRLSLKPVNPGAVRRVPSLRARRPAGSPNVSKSLDADVEITKVDVDQKQVFGWANVSKMNGQVVRDRQGDEIDIYELEKAAYDYVQDSRIGGDQHRRAGDLLHKSLTGAPSQHSTMIESMVFTPEKIEKMGLPEDFPQAWWVGYQLQDDEVWEMVKSGERTGFSVHGVGRREEIGKAEDTDPRRRTQQAVAMTGARAVDRGSATLKDRLSQAKNPPPVRRKDVESSAVRSVGYRPQTRELSVELHSKPGEPYNYKASKKVARRVVGHESPGKAYNREVRGKLDRKSKYSALDRGRLFVSPDEVDKAMGRGPLPSKAVREAVFGRKVAKPTGVTMAPAKMFGQDLKAAMKRTVRQGGTMPAYAARGRA